MELKKNLPVVQRPNKHLARRADVEVTLVSRDNFLLFTPMLHEVASGDLNPSDIVNPIRRMLKRVQFVQANVRSIDLAAKRVHCTRASSKPGRRRLWFKVSSFFLVGLGRAGQTPVFRQLPIYRQR
jgi:NADH dehydrogenase FAD-containing subunit